MNQTIKLIPRPRRIRLRSGGQVSASEQHGEGRSSLAFRGASSMSFGRVLCERAKREIERGVPLCIIYEVPKVLVLKPPVLEAAEEILRRGL